MQALRRIAGQAGLLPSARRMATAAQLEAAKAEKSHTVDTIGFWVMLPVCAIALAYDFVYPEEEFEGAIPTYPYLRMRTRETFPWGGERGLFEHHVIVGGTGEHHH